MKIKNVILLIGLVGLTSLYAQSFQHNLTFNQTQETAAQYFVDLKNTPATPGGPVGTLTIEQMIMADYVDDNLVRAFENAQKQQSLTKYSELPKDSQAIVDAQKKQDEAELAALIEAEHDKIPKK